MCLYSKFFGKGNPVQLTFLIQRFAVSGTATNNGNPIQTFLNISIYQQVLTKPNLLLSAGIQN